jgi:hypothetical protein
MMRALALLTLGIGLAGPALAQQAPGDGSSALVDDIAACRGVADTTARLACYDKAAAALQSARDRRELIVVSKETVKQTRRRLFGIALPQIKLFGDGVDEGEAVESITAKVTSARRTDYARWTIRLDDGSTWTTLEDFRLRGPRSGDTLVIKRAAMGSFLGSLNGARSVRMMRVE